jgi:hypothetical protein
MYLLMEKTMLSRDELMEIKNRLLISARMCKVLLVQDETSDEDEVRLTEEQYPIVVDAMTNNEEDVLKMLAEVDMLRVANGQFDLLTDYTNKEVSHGRDSDVPATGDEKPEADSVRESGVEAEISEAVGSGGPDGEVSSRPKPKRNRRRSKKNTKGVVRKTEKQEVDSGTAN